MSGKKSGEHYIYTLSTDLPPWEKQLADKYVKEGKPKCDEKYIRWNYNPETDKMYAFDEREYNRAAMTHAFQEEWKRTNLLTAEKEAKENL